MSQSKTVRVNSVIVKSICLFPISPSKKIKTPYYRTVLVHTDIMCAQTLAQCGLCACSLLCEPDFGIAVNSKLYEPSGGWLATLERGIHKKKGKPDVYLLYYTSYRGCRAALFPLRRTLEVRYGVCSCARSGMKRKEKKRSTACMHRTGRSFQRSPLRYKKASS